MSNNTANGALLPKTPFATGHGGWTASHLATRPTPSTAKTFISTNPKTPKVRGGGLNSVVSLGTRGASFAGMAAANNALASASPSLAQGGHVSGAKMTIDSARVQIASGNSFYNRHT